jgi:hypothetical protein
MAYIMQYGTALSVFSKYVCGINPPSDNAQVTNGMAIQVAIKDGTYTEA